MRRILFSTFVLSVLPLASHAQNYIPNNGYSGAGVVVNMDVLNTPAPSIDARVMSNDLPPIAPPIQMRRPMPQMAAPVVSAPKYIAPSAPNALMNAPVPSGRQALGSLHDAPLDEAPALPPVAPPMAQNAADDEMAPLTAPPAMPSPIMGDTNAIQSPAAASNDFEAYRLFFDPSSDELKPSETAVLDKIATKMNGDESLRLQVRAYAAGNANNAGVARRMSLTRSLKVRDYLMLKNISSTRLDVRALGSGSMEMGDQASSKAPADRVDLVFSK